MRVPLALALRRRPRVRRALALGLAVAVGLLVQRAVADADAVRGRWGPTRRVAVAARDLPPGHLVDRGDVRTVSLPPAAVPDDALERVEIGRVVRSLVLEGEVLGRRRVSRAGVGGVAALLPAGTRAVAVPIGAATTPPLRVGQRVDLVAVVAEASGVPEPVVVAAAVPVVAVREEAVSVAVARSAAPRVAAALAAGVVTVAVVAADPDPVDRGQRTNG